MENEHNGGNGRSGGGDSGGDGDFERPEEPTKVESQLGVVRAEGKLFAAICDPLDAAADALGGIEDALARVSPARRRQFLHALVLRLGGMGDLFHDLRRDYLALYRLEESRKDESP